MRYWGLLMLLCCLPVMADTGTSANTNTDFLSLWQFDNPTATEQQFVPLLDQLNGDDLAVLKTQIARTHGLRGNFTEAHKWLAQANRLLSDQTPLARTYYHLELGRTLNSSGDKTGATSEFKQALTHALFRQQHGLAVDAVHMLAIAAGGSEDELLWNLVALAMAASSEDPDARRWLGSLYNNIGWTYFDQGQFEVALGFFKKGVEARQSQDNRRRLQIALWTVARTQRALSNTEEALAIQRRLLAELETDGIEDGYVHEELGELLLTRDPMAAAGHFREAYRLLSADRWMQANEKERLARLKSLGK